MECRSIGMVLYCIITRNNNDSNINFQDDLSFNSSNLSQNNNTNIWTKIMSTELISNIENKYYQQCIHPVLKPLFRSRREPLNIDVVRALDLYANDSNMCALIKMIKFEDSIFEHHLQTFEKYMKNG